MEEKGNLKRSSTMPIEELEDNEENCLSKKAKILKEFPLNRHGSSNESQYVVLSQNDEVVDQSTLEYSVKDFLSDDDQENESDEEKSESEEKVEADDKTADDKSKTLPDTEENSDKTDDVNWDTEIKGDVYSNSTCNDSNTLQDDDVNNIPSSNENTNCKEIDSDSDSPEPALSKIESVYKDAEIIHTIIVDKNIDQIYDKLAEKRSNPNRLDVVTSELLEEPDSTTSDDLNRDVKTVLGQIQTKTTEAVNESDVLTLLRLNEKKNNRVEIVICQLLVSLQEADTSQNKREKNSIFDEVNTIASKFPTISPDEIYTLLEEHSSSSDRLQKVLKLLENKSVNQVTNDSKTALNRLESDPDNPLTKNDPIYQDMRVISKMFPEKDRNEIYAYLEAHHNKKDRIQVVIEELLGNNADSQDMTDGGKPNPLTSNRSHGEFENLCEIFPDCDPNYIFEQLEASAEDKDRMNNLAARMFERKDYPKLKEVLDKQQKITNKIKIQNMKFKMEEFLCKFPDPVQYFENNDKAMSASYKDHVLIQIKNDYPQLKDGYVKEVLVGNNHCFIKSIREIDNELNNIAARGRRSKKLKVNNRTTEISLPEAPDEFFFHELMYSRHELEIKMKLKEIQDEKKLRIDEARKKGELYECGCCFDDEVLFEDMSTCADGHLFCKECIRRSTEAAIGDAKVKFPCLTGTCEHDMPLSVLQNIVPPNLFSNILRKLQEEELRLADITDLVSCPYCSFATVMSDPNDKVFKCLNPECLKETCRLCQEPNHVPLKCNEVEKKTETDMRTFIENKISESMLRTCSNCKKRFFKDFGCNKMTCTCGTTMCYVCREPNIDYDHFGADGGCSNDNDVNALHQREMEMAAENARQQYISDHPELAGLELKYDPQKLVNKIRNGEAMSGLIDDDNDNEYPDDDDPDDDDEENYYDD